jgi:hypothetical protein
MLWVAASCDKLMMLDDTGPTTYYPGEKEAHKPDAQAREWTNDSLACASGL